MELNEKEKRDLNDTVAKKARDYMVDRMLASQQDVAE